MNWRLDGKSEELKRPLEFLLEGRELEYGEGGLRVSWERTEKPCLKVVRRKENVEITCGQKAHFFRGMGLLLAHLEEEAFAIEEDVYMDRLGVMLDCSRNAVPRVETLKGFIRRMALLGMNELLLYTEDLYEIPEYPYFGALRGRYTREELIDCDRYASMFGIELVPCIQTLAHLKTFLRWPDSEELRDNPENLLPEEENVYSLISAMLKEISRTFTSGRIHLGMDEAHNLGLGTYLKKHGYRSRIGIMKRHLSKVMELCREYRLEPMIWSDMYFNLASPDGTYYGVPEEFEWKEEEKPEKELTMVYWDYYHHDEATYERMLKLHRKLTDRVCFAGGVWTWNGVSPNYSKAFETTRAAMNVMKREKVRDVFATVWMDNGGETPFAAALLPLIFFAEEGFCERAEESRLQERLDMLGLGKLEDLWLLDEMDAMEETPKGNPSAANPSKELLYQDPLVGVFDGQYKGYDFYRYYGQLSDKLKAASERGGKLRELFSYYRAMADLLAVKGGIGKDMRRAYKSRDMGWLVSILEEQIPACMEALEELHERREAFWFSECKPQGYEVLDIRLGGVEARLKSTEKRLKDYIRGAVRRLEELEEERLPYQKNQEEGKQIPVSCNLWGSIVSAGNMDGV